MTIKKVLLIVAVVVVIAVGITGALYKQKLIQAALTNATLTEKAQALSAKNEADKKQYDQDIENASIKILMLQRIATEKDQASQSIVVKQANEIRALRFTAGTWEDRYNKLEPECLQLSAKVFAQGEEIGVLKLTIGEMKSLDIVKTNRIAKLESDFKECQTLLQVSIANTKSILKKSWVLKIFDHVKVGPGGGFSIAGVSSIGVYAIWAIN